MEELMEFLDTHEQDNDPTCSVCGCTLIDDLEIEDGVCSDCYERYNEE